VLRTFGPKGDEMVGGWKKLHNEELHNFKDDEMGRASSTHREKMNACRILVGKARRKETTMKT
jgi:hypothetical protein